MNDQFDPHSTFGTFDRHVLSERIATRLLTMIRERKLKPGDRLPPERELAAMMQVSRPSLREALRALTIMRVIENRRRLGTFITALEPHALVENISFILSLDVSTLVNVIEARKVIEPALAGMAAEKISSDELDELKAWVEKSEAAKMDHEQFIDCDLEIHNLIAKAARNNILSVFLNSINKISLVSRRKTTELPEVPKRTITDHRRLYEAIQKHDPLLASKVMLEHLNYVEEQLIHQSSQ